MRARGVTSFLDRDNLVSGLAWLQALEQALRAVAGVAVLLFLSVVRLADGKSVRCGSRWTDRCVKRRKAALSP